MMTRIIATSVILVHSLCVSRHRGAETQRNAQRIQKPRRHENTKEGSVTVTGECIDVVGRDAAHSRRRKDTNSRAPRVPLLYSCPFFFSGAVGATSMGPLCPCASVSKIGPGTTAVDR